MIMRDNALKGTARRDLQCTLLCLMNHYFRGEHDEMCEGKPENVTPPEGGVDLELMDLISLAELLLS